MKRELARKKDRPRDIIIRLTGSQKSQREYHLDEIIRLNEEIEELTRRHNMEIENLNHRLGQIKSLEIFRDLLSLDCPQEISRKITILECDSHRKSQGCIKKNCRARTMLISYLHHFLKI